MRTNEEGSNLCGNELPAAASRASASVSFRLAASRLMAVVFCSALLSEIMVNKTHIFQLVYTDLILKGHAPSRI
jgi:hypothetical protein